MRKGIIAAIGIVMALLVVGVTGCGDYFGSEEPVMNKDINSQQDIGIWVTGVGKVSVVPDVVILNIGAEAQAETVAGAQQQANEAMNAMITVFDSHGIDDKDIQTQRYSIQPVREWRDEQYILVGYRVTNIVTVKVRNIDDTESVIDDAVAAGGDYTIVNSVSFTVDEPETYYEDARVEAMADAKEKAQQLAELGGVKLGKPIYIAEYSSYSPTIVYYDNRAEEGVAIPTTDISPGETEIQMTVQVVYNFD
ncbi:MAG TPA: SIMPL domain-containing protein [Dehalococcoidia bacterium]|nr:SIMPL domain-containing protein [Dehalococcoidia bacterium]